MPYYSGDYYQGDNYAAGGLLSFVGSAIRKVAGLTPIGAAVSTLLPSFSGTKTPQPVPIKEPGITGAVHRIVPGGHTGYGRMTKAGGFTERRRPRMNVTNVHALKRAGRRVRGFLHLASSLGALPVRRGGKGKKLFQRKTKK